MLEVLRKTTGGWVAKVFIGLLVLSFAVWGIADIFTGFNARAVATVGDVEVPSERFRQSFQRELQRVSVQVGRPLSISDAQTLGLDQQVLSQLISEAALTQAAREKGTGVSNDQLAQDILNEPAFRSATGGFSRAAFDGFLRQVGMNEEMYLIERAGISQRLQVAQALVGDVGLTDTLLQALHDYQAETRTARYVILPASDVTTPPDPGDETLQSYFDLNKGQYRAPEYRRISILTVDPAEIASTIEVSEDDLRAAYDERPNDFQSPERRLIRQIPFDDLESAEAAKARIDGGATIEEIRQERGLTVDDINLGLMAKQEMLDPEIADVAFSLEPGAVSDPVEARFRTVIVVVDEVIEAGVTAFEDVRDRLQANLAEEQSIDRALDLYDLIEDDRAAGMTQKEISETREVPFREVMPIDRTARDQDGNVIADLPESQRLISEVFEAEEGLETDPLQIGTNGNVWFDLVEVIPGRDRTLDEVRDQVLSDWQAEQVQAALTNEVDRLEERLDAGVAFDDLAKEEDLVVTRSTPVSRTQGTPDLSQISVSAIFESPVGDVFNAAHTNGVDRVLGLIAGSDIPEFDSDSSLVTSLTDQLRAGVEDDLLAQYIGGLQSRYEATINQQAIDYALGIGLPPGHTGPM